MLAIVAKPLIVSTNQFVDPKMRLIIMRAISKAVAANRESIKGGRRMRIDLLHSLKIPVVVN